MDSGSGSDRERLTVSCKSCSHRFEADLQVDRASLEAMVVSNPYTCPVCGAVEVYTKSDHFPMLFLDRI